MKASALYSRMDSDFEVSSLKDDWSLMELNEFIATSFKERYIGVMLDNTTDIHKVYTATIPDQDILDKLLDTGQSDALLFSHHAMGYDPNIEGFPFYDIPADYLARLRQQRISLYVMHIPLDKNGEYSTSVSLARHLNLEIAGEFCEYEGIKCGVLCKTGILKASELATYTGSKIGHEVKLIRNGEGHIKNGLVAIAAGGGNVGFAAEEVAGLGINLYITGCTRQNPSFEPTNEFHRIIGEEGINVIGATHYSTEKYACIAMTGYFEGIGIPAEFIEGRYFLEDL